VGPKIAVESLRLSRDSRDRDHQLGQLGGKARIEKMTSEKRQEIASKCCSCPMGKGKEEATFELSTLDLGFIEDSMIRRDR
jgi:hypothetical protein